MLSRQISNQVGLVTAWQPAVRVDSGVVADYVGSQVVEGTAERDARLDGGATLPFGSPGHSVRGGGEQAQAYPA